MTDNAQSDETQTQSTPTGRRLSQRLKTVPSHLKETMFLKDVVKSKSESRLSTRSKKLSQVQSSNTKASSKMENKCQANITVQLKGNKRKNIKTTIHQDARIHQQEEQKEELVTMKRRGVTEEDDKPIKRRRLRKLHQTTAKNDHKEGEEAFDSTNMANLTIKNDKDNLLQQKTTPMSLTNSVNAQAKTIKAKQGLSTMGDNKRGNSNSNCCLIDEEENKDTLLQNNITVHEDIGKIEYEDRRAISDDNNDVSNQLHDGGVNADESQHEDNKKSSVPINSLQAGKREWTIKVMVIRRGSIEQYNSTNGSGKRWRMILMDEQGTSIDAVAFNLVADSMEQFLIKGKTYFISSGNPKLINDKYPHTHKQLEIFFTEQTEVEEATEAISLERLPYAYIEITNLEDYDPNSGPIDIFGIVSKVDALKEGTKSGGVGTYARQNVLLTIQSGKSINLTLWGDLAKVEGSELQQIQEQKPVIGLFKVKVSTFRGDPYLSTTATSTVHINPPLPEAYALKNMYNKRENHELLNEDQKPETFDDENVPKVQHVDTPKADKKNNKIKK